MLRKSGLSWNGNFEVMKRPGPLQEFLVDQKKQYIRLPYGQGWFKARTGPAPDTVVLKELLKKTSSEATPTHVGWNIDPQDWTNPSTTEYLTTVRDQICRGEGGIVLMHDHTRATNQNLACFIRLAKEAGHRFEDRPDRIIRRSDQIYLAGDRSIFESFVVPEIQVPLKKDCPSFLLEKPILAINWTLSSQEPGGPTYADFQTKLQELQSRAESKAQIKYDKAMQLLSAAIKIAPQNMLH